MELYCEAIFVECKRTRSECLSGLVAVIGRSDEVNEAIDKKNEQKERQESSWNYKNIQRRV